VTSVEQTLGLQFGYYGILCCQATHTAVGIEPGRLSGELSCKSAVQPWKSEGNTVLHVLVKGFFSIDFDAMMK
jgi:hypothetical protein